MIEFLNVGKVFNNKIELINHNERKRDFECEDCDKTFTSRTNLVDHRINTHEIHHICEQCYRRIVNPNRDLNFPIEIAHTGENCLCRRH